MSSGPSRADSSLCVLVFLDRDGTINVERHHAWLPRSEGYVPVAARSSRQGIRLLNQLGCPVVVISNQPVVARGGCSLETLDTINQRMVELLARVGATLDAIYICPHSPGRWRLRFCRKPETGLLEKGRRTTFGAANLPAPSSVGEVNAPTRKAG